MIEHLVLVEIPESAEPHREELAGMFRAFQASVPGVVSSVAATDFSGRCAPYSLVAVLRIDSREALAGYAIHPKHKRLIARLDELGCVRIVADIET